MEIALMAHDKKKELMTQLCMAYCGILSKHNLYATSTTGKYIYDATGLNIECVLSGSQGGEQQIYSRISCDEIDVLLCFGETTDGGPMSEEEANLIRMCDIHNIPVATNIATAEILIRAIENGDLDWREIVNPRSEYNRHRKKAAHS